MFLSIIIPCYNVAEHLKGTIDSLKYQPRDIDCEFIFVNDGSTDNTLELIRNFEVSDSRVRVIDKENGGVSAARNDAMDIMKGEYMLCLDGDDILKGNAIDFIYREMRDNKVEILIPAITFAYSSGLCKDYIPRISEGVYSVDNLFKKIDIFPISPKNIYQTSLININKLRFDETLHMGEVFEFTIRYLSHVKSVKISHCSFYNYVMRNGSAIHHPNYKKDITALYSGLSILKSGEKFKCYNSFNISVFKIVASFTLNKYLKNHISLPEALNVVEKVAKDTDFRIVCKRVVLGKHNRLKERLTAFVMLTIPSFALRIFQKINKFG